MREIMRLFRMRMFLNSINKNTNDNPARKLQKVISFFKNLGSMIAKQDKSIHANKLYAFETLILEKNNDAPSKKIGN